MAVPASEASSQVSASRVPQSVGCPAPLWAPAMIEIRNNLDGKEEPPEDPALLLWRGGGVGHQITAPEACCVANRAALIGGEAIAVFKTYVGAVFALGNYDPVSRASVLARDMVGSRMVTGESVDFVASPMHKQAYALPTGVCLDDPTLCVSSYDVVVVDGMAMLGAAYGGRG